MDRRRKIHPHDLQSIPVNPWRAHSSRSRNRAHFRERRTSGGLRLDRSQPRARVRATRAEAGQARPQAVRDALHCKVIWVQSSRGGSVNMSRTPERLTNPPRNGNRVTIKDYPCFVLKRLESPTANVLSPR